MTGAGDRPERGAARGRRSAGGPGTGSGSGSGEDARSTDDAGSTDDDADTERADGDSGGSRRRWLPGIPSRRSVRITIGVSAGLVVVYVGLLIAFFVDGRTGSFGNDVLETDAPPGGLLVSFDARSVSADAQTMTFDVRISVDESLRRPGENRLADDVHVELRNKATFDDIVYRWQPGEPIASRRLELGFRGFVRTWPFDRYQGGFEIFVQGGRDQVELPVDLSFTGLVQSWDLRAALSADQPTSGATAAVDLQFRRSLGTILFGGAIVLVMVALPVLSLIVAIPIYRGTRRLEPTFLSWFAAMLFAIVPLRNFLPGSPPPGSWVDVAVVLWVLVGLIAALVFAVTAWRRNPAPRPTP